jgi:hypothetical protein
MSPGTSAAARPNCDATGQPSGSIAAEILQRAKRGGRAIGAMFFALFGAVWLLIAYQLAHEHGWIPVAVVIGAALLLFGSALRVFRAQRGAMLTLRQTPESQRMRRQFRAINALQWIAAAVAVVVLHGLGLEVWVVPALMLVVGLHFLPLARVFHYSPHGLTGAVLIATALLYPLVSPGGPVSPIGSAIAGMTLWLAALWALRPVSR